MTPTTDEHGADRGSDHGAGLGAAGDGAPGATAARATGAPPGRAGRNLPAAIGVGVFLGGLIVASLLTVQWGFAALATAALMVGILELRGGMHAGRIDIPTPPVLVGGAAMMVGSYLWGAHALLVIFGLTLLSVVCWRALGEAVGAVRDIAGGMFVATYAPFLASFSCLMLREDDGSARVFVFCLATVFSDIGGYAAGVWKGKHPMAPSVSPKKSWEGFAGSVAACVAMGSWSVPWALGGTWWAGALLGVVAAAFATMGDLAESLLKRDLGIKDMGHLLPGHGGIMDRLDSLLIMAAPCWLLLYLLVPVR